MVERSQTRLWTLRAIFVALCICAIFWRLLPLQMVPSRWAGPDMIVALCFAWVLRRPEYAPPLLIAAVMLLADLLFQRPPGLWAALIVMGAQTLKSRAPGLRDLSFLPEWLTVAGVLIVLTLSYRLILAVLLVPQAPLGLSLIELLSTLIAYPVVALFSALVFGVRKVRPGDAASMGTRA